MNEFDLIKRYFNNLSPSAEGTQLGNGDDCALLQLKPDESMAVSVDTSVEAVHFPKGADAKDIAQRAFRTALSDLAAMAATPRWVTIALTLPRADEGWLQQFSCGLKADLATFNCELIGGDTTRGPLAISVQVMGVVHSGKALTRSGAMPGDAVFVTQTLGNGAASLLQVLGTVDAAASFTLESKLERASLAFLQDAFYRPSLALKESQSIAPFATSALDISDGLVADLTHVCKASQVAAVINPKDLPYSKAARQLAKVVMSCSDDIKRQCTDGTVPSSESELLERWALYGGDDYQLCFTANENSVRPLIESGELDATHIGYVVALDENQRDSKVMLNRSHSTSSRAPSEQSNGYTHFG